MPVNESGYVLAVGPDAEGHWVEVHPGEEYDAPSAPRTVTDEETEAALAAGDEPEDAAQGDSAPPADTGSPAAMTEDELRTALELAELDTDGDLATLQARYDEYTASLPNTSEGSPS